MLCVLGFASVAPGADFLLLSAMMANAEQIAGWIESLTGRRTLPLELSWKPTRQVRGCVVYGTEEIEELEKRLVAGRAATEAKTPPAHLRRELRARPFGFFCLRQTWHNDLTVRTTRCCRCSMRP